MEKISEIGIYDYINVTFPELSKQNKILYYKTLIQKPECLELHVEWLKNCPYAFLSEFDQKCYVGGVEKVVRTKFRHESEEKIQSLIDYYQSDEYKHLSYHINMSTSRKTPYSAQDTIEKFGLYLFITNYTPGGKKNQLETYKKLVYSQLDLHCKALFTTEFGYSGNDYYRNYMLEDYEFVPSTHDLPNLILP